MSSHLLKTIQRLCFILLSMFISVNEIHATLNTGDIAIIGATGDDIDQFTWIPLVNLSAGEIINFTDNGRNANTWTSIGGIDGEGSIRFTVPIGGISAGVTQTVVFGSEGVNYIDTIEPSNGISGINGLSTTGDQLIVWQGDPNSPVLIYQINLDANTFTFNPARLNNSTGLGEGLIVGTTAVAVGFGQYSGDEFDGAYYSGQALSGTKAQILTLLSNNANWTGGNTLGVVYNDGIVTVSTTISVTPTNTIPTLTTFITEIDTTDEDTEVELTFAELTTQGDEADSDGTVDAFVVQAVSTGTLKIGTSAGTATAFTVMTNDTIDATYKAYWTPANNENGILNAFTVKAKDDDGALSATAIQTQITINAVNDAPISRDFNITIDEDTNIQFQSNDFYFTDIDTEDTLNAIHITRLVSAGKLTLNGVDIILNQAIDTANLGNLIFTPETNENGTPYTTFDFNVNDGELNSITYTATMNVTEVDDLPSITSTPITSINANTLYSYELNASDLDGDDLNWTSITLANWITLNVTSNRLEGTPSCSDLGTHNIALILSDGTSSIEHNFTITVNNDNTCTLANIGTDADTGTTNLTSTLTASELNDLTDVSGAAIDNISYYQDYIISNADAFSTIATTGEVQMMITLVNNHRIAIAEVVEDIAGNANNISVTSAELNAIIGVRNALLGTNYTKALEAANYGNRENPTPQEIQYVIDAVNAGPDTDNDYIPDILDEDDDNDGVIDNLDTFPHDPTESNDADNDGWGDNFDPDDDNDDIDDIDEITHGLDPLDPSDANDDFDNDGISNKDEINNGLDPRDATDADKDYDGDGINNRDEINAGNSPYPPNEFGWLVGIVGYILGY